MTKILTTTSLSDKIQQLRFISTSDGVNWTQTAEGYLRGLNIRGFNSVVKTYPVSSDKEVPLPKRTRDGHLIYALPGCLSWANGEFIDD